MATCFGGVGDTPMENPKTQDVYNVSEDESQDEDLIRQLIHETAHLKQFVEDRDNEPREAIHDLEQRLNRLTLTLCQPDTPLRMCQIDTPKPSALHKRNHLWKVLYYKIYPS